MEKDRSRAKKDIPPPRKDDLTLIKGISSRIEKKLNDNGCFTFKDLVALEPPAIAQALAGLTGVSRLRIIQEDWVGQARKLAAGETQMPVEASRPIEPPAIVEDTRIDAPSVEPEWVPEQPAEAIIEVARQDAEAPVEPEKMTARGSEEAPGEIETPAATEVEASATSLAETPGEIEPAPPALLPEELGTEEIETATQQQMAIFTIEFLLDEHNGVDSTRVSHRQSGRERTWEGWQHTQLADFMIESATLNIPSEESKLAADEGPAHPEESESAPVETSESKPSTPLAEKARLTGTFHLSGMEALRAGSSMPYRTVAINEPFDVRLTLDLNELKRPGDTSLHYKASIYGKCEGRPGLVVGETQGSLASTGTATIRVSGNTLPVEGVYKLAAQVIVGLPGDELKIRPETTVAIRGGQIQVY